MTGKTTSEYLNAGIGDTAPALASAVSTTAAGHFIAKDVETLGNPPTIVKS